MLSSEVLRKLHVSADLKVFLSYNTLKIYHRGLFCAAMFESSEAGWWDCSIPPAYKLHAQQKPCLNHPRCCTGLCWTLELPQFLTLLLCPLSCAISDPWGAVWDAWNVLPQQFGFVLPLGGWGGEIKKKKKVVWSCRAACLNVERRPKEAIAQDHSS